MAMAHYSVHRRCSLPSIRFFTAAAVVYILSQRENVSDITNSGIHRHGNQSSQTKPHPVAGLMDWIF
jgi:hypothetical protein